MPAASLEEARMQLEVVDRMESKSRNLRALYCRLAGVPSDGSSAGVLPADPAALRARFAANGITLSERQTEAFLKPVLEPAGGFGATPAAPGVDYDTFVALAQPRAFNTAVRAAGSGGEGGDGPLKSPLPVGTLRPGGSSKPMLGVAEGEGIGAYGAPPDTAAELRAATMPISLANFVRKTNTSATGLDWDALALASAQNRGHSLEGESGSAGGGGAEGAVPAGPGAAAAAEEWAGMEVAGILSSHAHRLARSAITAERTRYADSVRPLIEQEGAEAAAAAAVAAAPPRAPPPRMLNPVLADDEPSPYVTTYRAATAPVLAPATSRRRAASAEPLRRRGGAGGGSVAVADHLSSAGDLAAAPASSDGGSGSGSGETARGRRGSSALKVAVDSAMPVAGIVSPRQAQVRAAATAIMAVDADASRRRAATALTARMTSSTIFEAPAYAAVDPTVVNDVRDKTRRHLYGPGRAGRLLSATAAPPPLPSTSTATATPATSRDAFPPASPAGTPRGAAPSTPVPRVTPPSRPPAGLSSTAMRSLSATRHVTPGSGVSPTAPYSTARSGAGMASPAGVHTERQVRAVAFATTTQVSGRSERRHDGSAHSRHFAASQVTFS